MSDVAHEEARTFAASENIEVAVRWQSINIDSTSTCSFELNLIILKLRKSKNEASKLYVINTYESYYCSPKYLSKHKK